MAASRRAPNWVKPRTALVMLTSFGAWAAAGAVATGAWSLVPFGGICAGGGLLVYLTDCALQKAINGEFRPREVWLADRWWAVAGISAGGLLGLMAPLYVA